MKNLEKIVEELELRNLLLNGSEEEIVSYLEANKEKIVKLRNLINFRSIFPLLAIDQLSKLERVFDTLIQRKTFEDLGYDKVLQAMKEVAQEDQKKQYDEDWGQAVYLFESDLGIRMQLREKVPYEQRITKLTKTANELLSLVKEQKMHSVVYHFVGDLDYLYFINYVIKNHPNLVDNDLYQLWLVATDYYRDIESERVYPVESNVKLYPKLLKTTQGNLRIANRNLKKRERQLQKTLRVK